LDSIVADLDDLQAAGASAERQRESVRRLGQAVERLRKTLTMPGVSSIADDVAVLTSRLERRIAVLSLALPLIQSGQYPESLREDVRRLLVELEGYDSDRSPERARTVTEMCDRLRKSGNADAIAVADAVNTFYNHYNVRGIISGSLINRLSQDTRVESGAVNDFILGADVYGQQTTTARVGARLLPNASAASIQLEVNGTSHADTKSYPRDRNDVVIFSQSVSNFLARRRIDITADGLRAGEPIVSVSTSNQVLGASTPVSGIPLLGSIGRSVAMSTAAGRRPEVEAIGSSRVRERVLPKFASESDNRVAQLNDIYQSRIIDRLTERKAFPEVLNFSSTSTHLFVFGRTARHDELGGYEPLLWLPGDSQVTIQLHESALNNAFAHAGTTRKKIDENTIARLTGEEAEPATDDLELASAVESVISIELSDIDPVRVRFENDGVNLGFHAASIVRGDEKLANQFVSVHYAFEPLARTVKVVRKGDIELRPVRDEEQRARTDAQLVSRFRDSLDLIFLPEFEVSASPQLADRRGQRVDLNLTELKIRDGWLSLSFR
jgi:hypothetical protein